MNKELITYKEPKSPISESFKTLRTNIQFMNIKGKLKTILVTSTLPGEGKSWISSNLAVTFAQTNKKVLLVDADMRKGKQYSIFECFPRPGLSNYLAKAISAENNDAIKGINKYIQKTEVPNLFLMAGGNIPPNPSELLTSPQMEHLLEELKTMFDIIVIDGTPNQLVTDSLILTRLVDSTLIVTAHNQTKKEDLKRAIENIKNVGGNISGIVLNKVPITAKRYEQSYYESVSAAKKVQSREYNRRKKNKRAAERNARREKDSTNNQSQQSNRLDEEINESQAKTTTDTNTMSSVDILKQINEYFEKEISNMNIKEGM